MPARREGVGTLRQIACPQVLARRARGRATGKGVEARLSACWPPRSCSDPIVIRARERFNSGDSFSHLWVRD